MKKVITALSIILLGCSLSAMASELIVDSKIQSYSELDNKIKFEGDVVVKLDDIRLLADSADISINKKNQLDTVTFYDKPYAYEVKNSKKREVKANILKLSLITKVIKAEGDSQTIVTNGKTPIVVITADSQAYNTKTNVMTAEGGVIIKYKDELETFSNKAVIHTNSSGDLKKIDLLGNAKIKEKNNSASADHFIYSTEQEELIAIGHTKSIMTLDDGDKLTIKGDYQQFNKKANTFTSSGNVEVWYQDFYANGPKMTVYPDSKTNKFNEIFFTGRSSITQGEKTIYADKIKLVMKPKNFFAEGQTRTVIRNIKSVSNGVEEEKETKKEEATNE